MCRTKHWKAIPFFLLRLILIYIAYSYSLQYTVVSEGVGSQLSSSYVCLSSIPAAVLFFKFFPAVLYLYTVFDKRSQSVCFPTRCRLGGGCLGPIPYEYSKTKLLSLLKHPVFLVLQAPVSHIHCTARFLFLRCCIGKRVIDWPTPGRR